MKKGRGFLSVRFAIALSVVLACILWAAAQYSGEGVRQVSGPEDLRGELRRAQKLAPPSDTPIVYDAGVFACVPGPGLTEQAFAAGLVARLQPGGGTLWPVTLFEDAASGETVFLNADGTAVSRMAPEPGAGPAFSAGCIFPWWRLPAVAAHGRDPSRVVLTARLSAAPVPERAWSGDSGPGSGSQGHARPSAPAGFKDYLVVWNSYSNIWLGGDSGTAAGVSMIDAGYSHGLALHDDGSVTRIGVDPDTAGITEQRFPSAGAMLASAGGLGDTVVLGFDGVLRHVSGTGELLSLAEDAGQVRAVVAGTGFLLALLNNGSVHALGAEACPLPPEGLSGVAEIGVGTGFCVARRHTGSAVVWGGAEVATNLASGVSSISASRQGAHCLALMRDGTVAAWGGDSAGQCRVPAGLCEVTAIAAGGFHSVALRRDGTVACWGLVKGAPALLSNVVAVGASYLDACAVTADGTVAVWGRGCPLGGVRLPAKTPGACKILDAKIVGCGVCMATVRAREGLLEGDADGDGVPAVEEVLLLGTDPVVKDAGFYAPPPAADPEPKTAPAKRKSGLRAAGLAMTLYSMQGGTTYYVDDSLGNDSCDGLSWETAMHTIQAAVDAAQAGDTVVVTNGVYSEGARVTPGGLFNNRLVVTNGVEVRSVNGAGATVIQGSGSDYFDTWDAVRCVYITDGVLDGFTLEGGAAVAHWTSSDERDKSGGCLNMIEATAESEVRNCIITGGMAYDGGGSRGGRLVNCVIHSSSACYGGGAYRTDLRNCTVSGNEAWYYGGGGFVCGATNSVMFGNTSWNSPNCHGGESSYSCVVPLQNGACNIDSDPLFTDAANGDFTLQSGSPCVDAGSNESVTAETDLMGHCRIQGGTVDMGACEFVVDTDSDGMPDLWETGRQMDPLSWDDVSLDPDMDGLSTWDEYLLNLYPLNPDSDDDGLNDGFEVDHGLNPFETVLDPDGDGLENADELAASTDPLNGDTDGDGVSDGPFDPDGEGSIIAGSDAFPLDAAAWLDTDGDNLPNVLIPGVPTALEEDTDDDGDGMSDEWESLYFDWTGFDPLAYDQEWPYSPSDDPDGDGLSNAGESGACTNPWAWDSDGDGLSDLWESVYTEYDPLVPEPDLDGDGLPDRWELKWFGGTNRTDSVASDPDGDGMLNSVELAIGSDPGFAASVVTTSRGYHMLSWTPMEGVSDYQVRLWKGEEPSAQFTTNVCSLLVTGGYSSAESRLEVSVFDPGLSAERVAYAEFRQPSRPNLTVWKIADPFTFVPVRPPQEGDALLEKVIPVCQNSQWPVIFLLSSSGNCDYNSDLYASHLCVQTFTDVGPTNVCFLRQEYNIQVTVEPGAQTLTVRLLWCEDEMSSDTSTFMQSPLHLCAWCPSIVFDSIPCVFETAEQRYLVNVMTNANQETAIIDFSVSYDGNPLHDGTGDLGDIAGMFTSPFGSQLPYGGDVTYSGREYGLVAGGYFPVGATGSFPIGPQGVESPWPFATTGPGFNLINLRLLVDRQTEREEHFSGCEGSCEGFPIETKCMKDKVSNGKAKGGSYWWEETEVAVGFGLVGPYSGISVSPLCHVWAKNETSIGVTVQIDGVGGFPIGTMTRADQESHQDDIDPIQCTCPGSVWSGCDGGCGSDSSSSCPNGSCSGSVGMEGPRLGSVDFRIPFGSVGYNAIAGMLWFSVKDNSVLLNQELLSVISNSSVAVSCYPSGGVSNIVCEAAGVNGITVLSFCRGGTNGLSLQVYDTTEPGQVPARVWEITDEGMRDYEGRTSTVRFRKLVGASVDRDSIFEYTGGRWRQTDLITGVTQTVNPVGDPEQGWDETTRCMWHVADPGKIISERTVRREKIGPVYRECVIKEKVGYTDVWRTTTNAYWVSEDYPALNGCPKFRYSDFNGDWEYRAYDTRGRETLRAEPLDGSTPPPFATSGTPATLASFTAGGLTAAVTVTGYEGAESESFLDVGKPRKVERYRVLEGVATKISCEWHTYTRELAPDGLGALRHRVIRACSQAAAQGDSANAWTETLEYDGDSRDKADTPPPLLRGKLLEETRFEGGVKAVTKSEYLLDTNENRCYVTTWKGTDTLENGVAGRSTFETVTLDAFTGLELGRETRLRVSSGDAPLLWEEARTYDAKGRLVATLYSDGTFESNDWSCCSLQAKIGRDGARTDLMYLPGYSGESLSEETSMGGLPGANGRHPAVVTLVDALGRVTNSVRKVMVNGNDDPNYAWLVTRTEYPDGTEDYKVTIGPLGVVTVSRRYFEVGCEIEETFSSGVTTRVTRVNGGSTVAERFWDGKWTKETQSSSTSDSGRRVDTVTIEASDIPEAVMTSETVYDYLGRPVVVTTPLGITSNFYDGASDTLVRVSQTGSPDTLYVYDELGNVLDTVLDVDGDGAADYDGTDRITRTRTGYQLSGASWWLVTSNEVWNADGVNAPLLVSTSSTRLTGLGSAANGVSGVPDGAILTSQGEAKSCQHKPYAFLYGPTMRTYTYTDRASATAWQVTDTPESSQNAVRVMVAGYAVSDISASSIPTAYTYDGFSRQTAVTDGRSNTTFTAYSALGLPEYTEDAASNLTSYTYDSFGRRTAVTNALGQATYTAYDPLGRVIATWGATYPVAYEYDTAGRMVAMATTRDSAQSSVNLLTLLPSGVALSDTSHASYPDQLDTTKWLYDQTTGLLTNKVYADGTGTAYSYTSAGRLATRTWARGVTTAYTYDSLGQLTTVDYSDATPDVTYTYDRLGRKTSAVSSVSAVSYTYSGPDLVSETQNGETLARTHDGLGRVETMNYIPQGLLYGYYEELRLYDDYGRLSSIHARSPHNTALSGTTPYDASFEYAYLPGTDIPQSMTAWHLSDYLDEYGNWVPQADQTLAWTRSYDPARNLITGVENRFGGQPVSSFTYVNDAIGRRTQRTDFDGSVYTANAFSYNARSEVAMAQMGNNTYTYNYDPIGNRRFALANGARTDYAANSLNQYTGITGGSVSSPTYDADGNMLTCTLSTGTWYFFWDGENRLICVSNMATVVSNAYDHHSRRIRKEVYVRESPSFEFQFSRSHSFLWDGWNPLCESVTPGSGWMNPADVYSYTWGLDLSGTAQGAGGVCGLLAEYVPFAEMMGFGETYYPAYDANGNITAYLDTTGATAATFEYDAFGNTISEAVSPGLHLPFRFSTKYADAETGLVMYQLRAYSTGLGRWLSRDPIGIRGGFNPCHYVCNSPVNRVDFLGLYGMDVHYYLTYYLAAKCGLTEGTEFGSEADMIAWADQQTDDAVSTQPLTTVSAQRRKFHFRHEKGQRVQRGSDVAKDPAQSGVEAEDPLLFGMGLHALQDSYSHENAKEAHGVPPFFRGDDVSSDVAKSIQMAQEIYDMLDQYRHKKYCKHCDAKFADFASGLRETIRKNRITQDLGDSASGYYKDYLKGYTFFDDRAAGVSDPLGH